MVMTIAVPAAAHAQAETVVYKYDALGRLQESVRVDGPNWGQVSRTAFDAAGKRTNYSSYNAGLVLNPGQSFYSQDHRYQLSMQGDGNLVLYGPSGALWATSTNGTSNYTTIMQGDGNLVVYADSIPKWASGTAGVYGAQLQLQNSGNLRILSDDASPIWATNTGSALVLNAGQSYHSPDGRFQLSMQTDGNFVLYGPSGALWATGTNGTGADRATFQLDGNLVVYAGYVAKWASGTGGIANAELQLLNDGNLQILSSQGRRIWTSNTGGH